MGSAIERAKEDNGRRRRRRRRGYSSIGEQQLE